MRSLDLGGPDSRMRARRWDAVVLGGALPGLVAAVRMGMSGARVLVVEERASTLTPPLLREPFFLAAAATEGVVQSCLTALGVPMIERRGFVPEPISYQVVFPDARVDVGDPGLTHEELVAFGLAKPESARDAVHGLLSGAKAEGDALLEAPIVRRGVKRQRLRGAAAAGSGHNLRGLPGALARPEPALARFIEAQLRALTHAPTAEPSPEARARLLGAALEGGARPAKGGLYDMLRRRIQALHGEMRTLPGPFELVEADGHPGILADRSRDAWLGRLLVINARPEGIARVLAAYGHEAPRFLEGRAATHRSVGVLLRATRDVIPEAMAPRLILAAEEPGTHPVRVALGPCEQSPRMVEIAAAQLAPIGSDEEAIRAELTARVTDLLPFSERRLRRVEDAPVPQWDDDGAVADPASGRGWPTEVDIRTSLGTVVYLDRDPLGTIGVEGDLLLGWHGGDTVAAELA